MLVGKQDEMCVTLDTPGVPHDGGRYGKPRWFARAMKPLGYVLAWNCLWERFEMFRRQANGQLVHEWGFSKDGGFAPQPITEEHALVFRYLRHRYPTARRLNTALARMARDEKEQVERQREQQFNDLESDITRRSNLNLGIVTPKAQIIVPGYANRN